MTVRKAIIFYLSSVVIALIVAWAIGYFVAWWAGMFVLTLIVADHVRYTVKKIIERGR